LQAYKSVSLLWDILDLDGTCGHTNYDFTFIICY